MPKELEIHFVPIILLVLLTVAFLVLYLWSVALGHVSAALPYISDLGAFPPESSLFAESSNIATVIIAFIVYFRYLVLRDFAQFSDFRSFPKLIHANLIIGLTTAFSGSLVANYQSIRTTVPMHEMGAFLVFILGATFLCIDSVISYKIVIIPNQSQTLSHVRLVIASLAVLGVIVTVATHLVADSQRITYPERYKDVLLWDPEDGGYAAHLVSVVTEWLTIFCHVLYYLSFCPEFKQFRLLSPRLRAVDPGIVARKEYADSDGEREPLMSKNKQFIYIGTGGR